MLARGSSKAREGGAYVPAFSKRGLDLQKLAGSSGKARQHVKERDVIYIHNCHT